LIVPDPLLPPELLEDELALEPPALEVELLLEPQATIAIDAAIAAPKAAMRLSFTIISLLDVRQSLRPAICGGVIHL
jgi:hypothetical protein